MNDATGLSADAAEEIYRAALAVNEHSARHLRRLLRLYLTGWDLLEVADAAELALTELIANVVRHVPGRCCQACILLLPAGGVRVEVADGSPQLPCVVMGDELDEGGRGLLLVAALTDSWGVELRRDGCGKTVWFECLAAKAADAPVPGTAGA
ncbi:ATP-binding protein [Streptomyces sp. NBC_01500]|uniref:ATP-binding protein n=1 Tax=Streptomyces sp. NBC_01500 TaxID=2903886 RepID=UPI00224D2C08|nr:ATP-binding protein [Streptomyces sp. NBC_01500]MCX4551319.1 ATP-binding protein [Streptomyces sp. NBC_01500]